MQANKLKNFFKHPKYLKKQQEFERINSVVNKIKKLRIRSDDDTYLQELIIRKSNKAKERRLKEIDDKIRGINSDEISNNLSTEQKLSKVKSLDYLQKSSFKMPDLSIKNKNQFSFISKKNSNSGFNHSKTFLTGINENNNSGFIKEIINSPKAQKSSAAQKRYMDHLNRSLTDKS